MSGKKFREFLKRLNYVSLIVPIGAVLAIVFFPLRPIVHQALIGVVLIWFGVEAMTGFPFWQ